MFSCSSSCVSFIAICYIVRGFLIWLYTYNSSEMHTKLVYLLITYIEITSIKILYKTDATDQCN